MRPIVLSISRERTGLKKVVIGIWIAVGALALFATYQGREVAAAKAALLQPEILAAKTSTAGALATPTSAELALERVIRAHAEVRFASWSDAMASLAEAVPRGATIERVTLNAKTGRGDATVRVGRVEDVSRTVEALESARNFSAAAARRCEQGRARDQLGMRCELGFNWTRSSP